MPVPCWARPGTLSTPALALLLALGGPLRADVRVLPQQATLVPGGTCRFKVSGHPSIPGNWHWTLCSGPGEIHPATGLYRASGSGSTATARVRATAAGDPGAWGEASVVLLPATEAPLGLVSQVLGGDWLEPYTGDAPFLDLATGARFVPARMFLRAAYPDQEIQAACGIPFALTWNSPPAGARQLLSYREGEALVRREVTGQTTQVITWRGPVANCMVETLEPLPDIPNAWNSRIQRFQVELLGLVPVAGNPVAEPGHRDGQCGAARFRQPFGVALAPDRGSGQHLLVTDRESHVVRIMDARGRVSTLCGQPDHPGHRDSPSLANRLGSWLTSTPALPALLNGPTHLALRHSLCRHPDCPHAWTAYLSDSGNHVIRTLAPDGRIGTLAGRPGQPGYQDSHDPAQATFRDPQGIAVSRSGPVYVADRGNRVIRVIEPGGRVTTLAGHPGARASRDGLGLEAGFTDLKGLALDPTEQALYALDGHAARRIALPSGHVTTLLGVVDTPGFRDIPNSGGEHGAAARQPCLNDPTGLLCTPGHLYLADRGNHALRVYRFDQTLATLMGGPGPGRTRRGLPRDTPAGEPLDEECATLDGPTSLACTRETGDTALLVPSGRCLTLCLCIPDHRDTLAVRYLEARAAGPGSPATLGFGLETRDPEGFPTPRAVHYSVDCLHADGAPLTRIQGWSAGWEMVSVPLDGAEQADQLSLRCVTDQGIVERRGVALRPEP